MNLKISLLAFVLLVMPVCLEAQTARNPLNLEPARVSPQKRLSAWKLSEEIFCLVDGATIDKRSVIYDENGRKKSDITLRWNQANDTWQNALQSNYHYETEKEVVMTLSNGMYNSKTETFFGSDNKPAYSLTYQWNKEADDWSPLPCLRSEWQYNSFGLVSQCLKQYWNSNTRVWNPFDIRILYSYNEAGVLIEEIYQTRNPEPEGWVNKGKYAYSTDNENQKTATSYVFAAGRWMFDGKTVYLYDEEGKITRCEFYNREAAETFSAFSLITYSESIESPDVIESKEVTVYPNPVVSSFEVTIPEACIGKNIQLFDMTGKQVKMLPALTQKTLVDISGLSSGLYLLRIDNLTKKVVLK